MIKVFIVVVMPSHFGLLRSDCMTVVFGRIAAIVFDSPVLSITEENLDLRFIC